MGLDVRGTTLAARGWTEDGGDLWEVLGRLEAAGCSRYVVTDVTKDGTLRGPNVELLAEVARRAKAPVVAVGWHLELRATSVLCVRSSRRASIPRSSARLSTRVRSRCPGSRRRGRP